MPIFQIRVLCLGLFVASFAGCSTLSDQVAVEVSALLDGCESAATLPAINADDLERLPGPVQRHLRWSGVVGKNPIRCVYMEQSGKIKNSPDGDWMTYQAVQHFSVNPPAFVWFAKFGGVPPLEVKDSYVGSSGHLKADLASLVTVAEATGVEADKGELLRYLSEMVFFPTAFADPLISWRAIDDKAAEATLADGDISVSGIFRFDQAGEMIEFTAQRHYGTGDGEFRLEKWSTRVSGETRVQGVRIPRKGFASWHLDEGTFEYVQIRPTLMEYTM